MAYDGLPVRYNVSTYFRCVYRSKNYCILGVLQKQLIFCVLHKQFMLYKQYFMLYAYIFKHALYTQSA